VVFEPHDAAAEQFQIQEQEKRMNGERMQSERRAGRTDRPLGDVRLDVPRALEQLKIFLDLIVREMNLAIEYEISSVPAAEPARDGNDVTVAFRGADQELLLERNAELLLALEYLGHRWLRLDPRLHDRVRFDCGDYRATHLEELKLSARVAAQRVRETGQPFHFNPMSPRERRILHMALTGAAGVRTESEGSGDRRQLVIYPSTKK
jgi:spoIIIJ-associated protein